MTTDETMTPTAPVEPEAPANQAGQASDHSMTTPSDDNASAPAEPTPAPRAERAAPKVDDASLFEAAMREMDSGEGTDDGFKKLSKGDRVEATVIQVDKDRVFVDLGTKSEGIVPL